MPVVLKIGYYNYLMRNEAQAATALKVLSGAVALKADFDTDNGCWCNSP